MKRCYSCKRSQGEQNYCKDRHRPGGLSNLCRKCMSKRYYETRHHKVVNRTKAEKEENNRKTRAWYAKNGKAWYEKNKKACKMRATLNMAFRQGVVQKRNVCDKCGEKGKTICMVISVKANRNKRGNIYKWKEHCRDCRREIVYGFVDN